MRSILIMQGGRFSLTSHGNGFAYTLQDSIGRRDVFIQGEDASTFRDCLDALEDAHPLWTVDEILGWLWDECSYGDAAKEMAEDDAD